MSYILEALKKAERERRKDSIPDLQAHHTPYPAPQSRYSYPKRHLTLLLGSLLVLTITAASLFYLRRDPVLEPTPTPPERRIQEKQLEQATPESKQTSRQPMEQKQRVIKKKEVRQVTIEPQKVIVEPRPIVMQQETIITPPPARKQQPVLPTYDDLASTMGDLPRLSLAGHTYSDDPEQRMIIINSRIVRENQGLGNGLRLEEITWDGLILNFKGNRFTMKASQ